MDETKGAGFAELTRFNFLVQRDGLVAAKQREAEYVIYYLRAAEAALQPRMDNENKCVARGREWAEIYLNAAIECDYYAQKPQNHLTDCRRR